MSKIGILSVSSNGLDNTFVEGKQAPGPIFFLPEMWDVDGDISLLSDWLDDIINAIDYENGIGNDVHLVNFPEMGASLGQYPQEIEQNQDGSYRFVNKNALTYLLEDFISSLADRNVGCIIQTMIRVQGWVTNQPELWVYMNSSALFVDYTGRIFDVHYKTIMCPVVNDGGDGYLITDAEYEPGFVWLDHCNPYYIFPIYEIGNINLLYVVCVEANSSELLAKANTLKPTDGYDLLAYCSYGAWGAVDTYLLKTIIPQIQARTYSQIRTLANWDTPAGVDIAKSLADWNSVMSNSGYLTCSANNNTGNNLQIGSIQVNFDALVDYDFPGLYSNIVFSNIEQNLAFNGAGVGEETLSGNDYLIVSDNNEFQPCLYKIKCSDLSFIKKVSIDSGFLYNRQHPVLNNKSFIGTQEGNAKGLFYSKRYLKLSLTSMEYNSYNEQYSNRNIIVNGSFIHNGKVYYLLSGNNYASSVTGIIRVMNEEMKTIASHEFNTPFTNPNCMAYKNENNIWIAFYDNPLKIVKIKIIDLDNSIVIEGND